MAEAKPDLKDLDLWEGINLRSIEVCKREKPRILYICTWYKKGDGLSTAIRAQIREDETDLDYTIMALRVWEHEKGLNIEKYNSKNLRRYLKNNRFDLIHYYLGTPSNILKKVVKDMKAVGSKIPILCTVCQSPSHNRLLISPFELRHIHHFVFIDKTAYFNPLISFIPIERRSQIYLTRPGRSDRLSKNMPIKQPKTGKTIFGRGTTLPKCPRNLFEVWDKINVPGKELHIAGVPKNGNWVQQEAEKRNDVVFHGFLPFEKWVEVCNSWDIILYHLPNDSYASLDSNLGLGMLLRKPIVYLGPGVGKERIAHGENGFIAKNEDEFIKYAEMLAAKPELWLPIGHKARESVLNHMITGKCDEKYDYVYRTLLHNQVLRPIKVLLSYRIYFIRKSWRRIIKSWLGIRNKKDLLFWRPLLPDAY